MNRKFLQLFLGLLATSVLVFGCISIRETPIKEVPVIDLDNIIESGRILRVRIPFSVFDERYHTSIFQPSGVRDAVTYEVELFPADIWITLGEMSDSPVVFLARSPHGGCLIMWMESQQYFEDPCFGSRFKKNGDYLFGPATRNLDQLPARLDDGVVWVANKIIYGRLVDK